MKLKDGDQLVRRQRKEVNMASRYLKLILAFVLIIVMIPIHNTLAFDFNMFEKNAELDGSVFVGEGSAPDVDASGDDPLDEPPVSGTDDAGLEGQEASPGIDRIENASAGIDCTEDGSFESLDGLSASIFDSLGEGSLIGAERGLLEENILMGAFAMVNADYTIDLCTTVASGTGYTVSGSTPAYTGSPIPPSSNRGLTFTSAANGKVYRITQSYALYSPPDPAFPKAGSSIFTSIIVPGGVDVTVIINDIDFNGAISVTGGKLTLILDDKNYIRSMISVPTGSELIIDSYNDNNAYDRLIMSSPANSTRYSAYIGGNSNPGVPDNNGIAAGTITINGGGIKIDARSTGAGIGGGGGNGASGRGASGGNITITGGNIEIYQYGSGNDLGGGIGGAAIGGGGGMGANGGDGGNIHITGGTINVTQRTRGAAIGGGSFGTCGNVTIDGGTVNATMVRAAELFGAGEGSAIGSSAGTNSVGQGYITINGGNITAIASSVGGAGIGIANGGQPCAISITGGTIYAKSTQSAGIGVFGEERGSSISITGGTVVAESLENAAIGGRVGPTYEPALHLSSAANVTAYCCGPAPAINAQNNTGNGYFVNAGFDSALSASSSTTLKVYAAAGGGTELRTLSLPAGFRNFAYSSGLTKSRIDNIIAYNGSAISGIVVRKVGSSPEIYSIINRSEYNAYNSNANNGYLPVILSNGSGVNMTVTEKYVDVFGAPIPGKSDTTQSVAFNTTYGKAIPPVTGCNGKGHKWDSVPGGSGTDYTSGAPSGVVITANRTIYFVYETYADVTVSKTVTGKFGDKNKSFPFTVQFFDGSGTPLAAGGTYSYDGGVIPGSDATAPPNGVLTLAAQGKATFNLKHGQKIKIKDVPPNYRIEITETADPNYITSYLDNANPGKKNINYTGIQTVGSGSRAFDFENYRDEVPLVGVKEDIASPMILLFAMLAMLAAVAAAEIRRRKRSWTRL